MSRLLTYDNGGFELVGNAFKITGAVGDIDDLKKAIKTENAATVQCDAFQIDIFSQQEDDNWSKEDEEASIKRGVSKSSSEYIHVNTLNILVTNALLKCRGQPTIQVGLLWIPHSIEVGNLGIASAAQGDLQTSRICLQYHLSSAQRGSKSMAADNKFAQNTLKEVSKNAYHRLGQVNATDGRFDEAADHFAKAMEVAKSANQQKDEEVSLAMLGIARGMLSFDEHCAALVRHAEEAAIDADDVRNAT
ncbi:unnamed protein product [Durusdinium trenchii]|uniref:Uncharacterized protein n=1 Tax=Durusdinium trenchii TaxID=1381693 RepID=A0ABP0QMN3_9DINO